MGILQIPTPASGKNFYTQAFTSTTTFTLPSTGINHFDCVIVAGGGGGGRGNTRYQAAGGGGTTWQYFKDVYCTAGTTLTITIGGGGAGRTGSYGNGSQGVTSSITGIAGSGTLTAVSVPGGVGGNADGAENLGTNHTYGISTSDSVNASRANFGPGIFGYSLNSSTYGTVGKQTLNEFVSFASGGSGNTPTPNLSPLPLMGSYATAAQGSSGATASFAGGASTASTNFAGNGGPGGEDNTVGKAGVGGGGGGGGASNSGGVQGGTGGNASANSGGGGGGGGSNSVTNTNAGNGGNGGSGFIIIGYWA